MSSAEPILDKISFACASAPLPVASVDEEYVLVEQHAAIHYSLRRAFPIRQKLQVRDRSAYDILYLDLPDGSVREYWFDITAFYGRAADWLPMDEPVQDTTRVRMSPELD